MADVAVAPEIAPEVAPEDEHEMPEYVQKLGAEQKAVLDKLCELDDQYLVAADKMRQELVEIEAQFARAVGAPLLASRKELLAENPIPQFWLNVLRHSNASPLIKAWDLPVIEHLEDITAEDFEDPTKGWKLHFHFAENEFFSDTILTKTYHTMRESKYDADLDVVKIESTEIDWNDGKDVTVAVVTKGKGKKKKVKKVPRGSFFRFFVPLGEDADFPEQVPDSDEEEDEDEEEEDEEDKMNELVGEDTAYAEFFKSIIIPHAVRHYTNEAVEVDSDEDSDDEADGSDSEGDFETPQKSKAPKPAASKKK